MTIEEHRRRPLLRQLRRHCDASRQSVTEYVTAGRENAAAQYRHGVATWLRLF